MPARISSRNLVERRAELEALELALERAADGDPTVTLVIGEAGIGKSRLLREVELHARAQGMAVATGWRLWKTPEMSHVALAMALFSEKPGR